MRLTKQHKKEFVYDVMKKVPKIDYLAQVEKQVKQIAVDQLPPKVRAVYDDEQLRGYLHYESENLCDRDRKKSIYIAIFKRQFNSTLKSELFLPATDLLDLHVKQDKDRKVLEAKLSGVCNSCVTLKQLKEALPEFEEFMPKETEQTRNLPAIANVVGDFMAAGLKLKGTAA